MLAPNRHADKRDAEAAIAAPNKPNKGTKINIKITLILNEIIEVYIFKWGFPSAIKVSPNGPETELIKNPIDRMINTALDDIYFVPKSISRITSGKKQMIRNKGKVV